MLDFLRFHDTPRGSKRRVAVYVKYNTEARSSKQGSCGKAISITYSECVFVALVIQRTERMRPIKLSYSTLSHIKLDFRLNFIEHRMCVLRFCSTLSETFIILRRIHQDVTINVQKFSCKSTVVLVRFLIKLGLFPQIFEEVLKLQIS